ncbi:hypothetical protein SLS53_000205 [Cytospora paraplurivora]|uniref:Uncharacterized protein n=1 Tax=Cytospora paraplurivora TaxID=2898453 RepID=A0AAN9YPA4_9PEZI
MQTHASGSLLPPLSGDVNVGQDKKLLDVFVMAHLSTRSAIVDIIVTIVTANGIGIGIGIGIVKAIVITVFIRRRGL